MQRFKKHIALTLCLVMLLSAASMLVTACGGSKTITMAFIGTTVSDDKEVINAVNARLKELGLNFKFQGVWDNWDGDRSRQALDTGDKTVDIVFAASWGVNYPQYAQRGMYVRLDDPNNNYLTKYPGMVNAVPSGLWDAFRINGKEGTGVYAVPGYKDYSVQFSWLVNNTRLAELGFDFDSFNWNYETMFDPQFEAALAAAKVKYGDSFYPLLPEISNFVRQMVNSDADPTNIGALYMPFDPIDPSKPAKIQASFIFDDPAAQEVIAKLEEFYQKGYINPRSSITGEAADVMNNAWDSGEYLFSSRWADRSFAATSSGITGQDIKVPPISSSFISTTSAQGSGFGVSVYSQNKDEAVQFLNAIYTDPKLATLLAFGVEGIHYNTNADGTVSFTEKRSEYTVWPRGIGNFMIIPPTADDGPDFVRIFKAIQDEGVSTSFNGFILDATPFESELAALRNVSDEYNPTITTGAGNAALLAEYRQKLFDNGLQKVIDEVNRQLNEFYASR